MTDGETLPHARRRTGEHAPRTGGRSARVVNDVLEATLAELASVGYGALRVDDVAARAGVNKTSIYRRWPTKPELVLAALRSHHAMPAFDIPDTGSLDEDCFEALRRYVLRARSPQGLATIRLILLERANPEVLSLAHALREDHRTRLVAMIDRGVARGELDPSLDRRVVVETLVAPVLSRIRNDEHIDDRFLRSVVALVLDGARNTKRVGSRKASPRSR